ncbi:hypothetical protein [Alteriqipengyuania sp. 357]
MTTNVSNDASPPQGFLGRGPIFWGALFVIAMFATAFLASSALEGPAAMAVMLLPMALLFPLVKASERKQAASGCASPAMVRYNRRAMFGSFGYVLGLGIALSIWNRYDQSLSQPVTVLLALLPTLPTFVMIWAMGRYLVEETDEYLRYRTVLAALMSLGMVLAIGIFYGFLETFGLVPHVWAWWVLPVWAVGLGISHLILRVRGR